MRSCSRSPARRIISGALWISTAYRPKGVAKARAGRSGSEPAQQEGGQAAAAQAAEAAVSGPPRHDHGQAETLWRGQEGDHARRRAPPAQGAQQPGGKLTPADPTTKTAD